MIKEPFKISKIGMTFIQEKLKKFAYGIEPQKHT